MGTSRPVEKEACAGAGFLLGLVILCVTHGGEACPGRPAHCGRVTHIAAVCAD